MVRNKENQLKSRVLLSAKSEVGLGKLLGQSSKSLDTCLALVPSVAYLLFKVRNYIGYFLKIHRLWTLFPVQEVKSNELLESHLTKE